MKSRTANLYPLLLASVGLLPLFAEAQTFSGLVSKIQGLINTSIALLFAIAALIFIYGVLSYISKQDDDAAKKKARSLMLWGIIGIAVMAGFWGLVRIVLNALGLDTAGTAPVPLPTVPTIPN